MRTLSRAQNEVRLALEAKGHDVFTRFLNDGRVVVAGDRITAIWYGDIFDRAFDDERIVYRVSDLLDMIDGLTW
jgi:hypothetical protein